MTLSSPRIGVVGRGRAARSLVPEIERSGLELSWWWSRGESPTPEHLAEVDIILLAVPDAAIEEAAKRLSVRPSCRKEVWLHLSGCRPAEVCRVSVDLPRAVGCLHPLQSLSGTSSDTRILEGVTAGIDGDKEAIESATSIATRLGMRPHQLRPGTKALYHAAAVSVCGHVTALFAQAQSMLLAAGFDHQEAAKALHPLLERSVANLASGQPNEVVTGPITRGDATTISEHLRALESLDAELSSSYRVLARAALKLSESVLEQEQIDALRNSLTQSD